MSDIPLRRLDPFLQWKLGVDRPSLAYAAKAVAKTILFAVNIPYPLLKSWHSIMIKKPMNLPSTESSTCMDMQQYTYTDFLEYSIPEISRDETIRSRINKSIPTQYEPTHRSADCLQFLAMPVSDTRCCYRLFQIC